jgi:hypothetical protein
MNEQMNALFNEAVKAQCLADNGQIVDNSQQILQRFAELIVRECADIAKHHVMNISTYADADFVDEQIKEHFGVEE